MKNIYVILSEMNFENKCEKYALGFQRDTDTPTMTKFRQENMKQFAFSLIQEFYEKALGELFRTRTALDTAIDKLKGIKAYYDDSYADPHTFVNWHIVAQRLANDADDAIKDITALEQKD